MKTEDVRPGAMVCLEYLGKRHVVQVQSVKGDDDAVVLLADGTPVRTTPGQLTPSDWNYF